jgi:hypothetical protein
VSGKGNPLHPGAEGTEREAANTSRVLKGRR